MLTQREIVPYLMERQLISAASIVEGDLSVRDSSRRNRNFMIVSERGPSYLVKQGVGPEGRATVAHEAMVYQLLQSVTTGGGLNRYLPHCYGYDPEGHVLILELVRNGENLRDYHGRGGRFSTTLAAAIGDALGRFHRMTREAVQQEEQRRRFPDRCPWILSIHRPDLNHLRRISSAGLHLIQIVQQFPEFCDRLDALRRGWKSETLIHCDVKSDNFVVFSPANSRRRSGLKIVDWELTSLGDPCWDIGSVFQDYLSVWLLSIPITGETPPDRFAELARYPLETIQPAMRSFWHAYVHRMELDATTAGEWLDRTVQYTAAKLVQTGYEYLQPVLKLTGNVVCLLQLGLNMMRRPHDATVGLLGIPLA